LSLAAIDLNGQPLTAHQYTAGGREQYRQQGALLSEYQYDEQDRLRAHSLRQDQQRVLQRHYRYDANGNLAGIDDSRKGSKSFHYDPLDRLVAVRGDTPESFAHDPAGTLLGQSGAVADDRANVKGNRLLMQGDRHFDYDAFGNLMRERRGTGQRLITDYRYDSQHRLIGASLPDGSQVTYRYDAFGRRIAKVVDGKTSEFLWQGDRLIAESGPEHYRSYLYEPGSFRPLAMLQGKGATAEPFYYQLDHLGTPQELTSAAGEILWSVKYRAYGNVAKLEIAELDNPLRFQGQYYDAETGLHYNRHRYYNPEIAEVDNPLRFQGQYYDAETGLHYNRHRYYNPNTGSYLTPDPIKLAGGLNNYQYVNNPTGWVDPLGLAGVKGDCPEPDDRRAQLNEKYGRTGNINDDINSRGRKETATEFYRNQGFEEGSIPGHLNGIYFSKPVSIETLNRGKTVYQFQSPGAPQGNYYSLNSATTPSELGIGPLGDNRAAGTV